MLFMTYKKLYEIKRYHLNVSHGHFIDQKMGIGILLLKGAHKKDVIEKVKQELGNSA